MKAILFDASMVGQGLLRECLLDPIVEHVLSISLRLPFKAAYMFRQA
jgi:hypothetical protein